MERLLFKFSLWLLVLIFIQMNGCRACLEKERIGLLEFKAFLKSNCELDDDLDSWVEDRMSNCCAWERVKCNTTSRRVVDLSLDGVVKYSRPESRNACSLNLSMLYRFEELLSLDLSSNWFNGWIDQAGFERAALTLKKLQVLDMSRNRFNNSILSFVNVLVPLKTLILQVIGMDGLFPIKELTYLKNLETLDIRGNQITGTLPMEGFERATLTLKNLRVLDLSYNNFNNSTVSFVNVFTSLKTLILEMNDIAGLFPIKDLAYLKNLETLDISNNQITGFSMEGFERLSSLKKLKILDLSSNHFNNSILLSVNNLVSLKTLILVDNKMIGQFPNTGLANMKNLKTLDMSFNSFEGILSIEGLCRLKSIVELVLSHNQFFGPLPQCLGNLSNLQFLDVSYNHFSGEMQSIVSKLTSIKCLLLSGNSFEGLFSFSAFANHSKLEVFELSSGSSKLEVETENPTWFPTFQLKIFNLPSCHLNVQSRKIPSFLLYQYGMKFIDLSHNKLVGAFPSWILQNNSKLKVMHLMNNSFTGTFQLPNFNHYKLAELEISSNNITGQLPKEFGLVLSNLQYIGMSRNSFHGNVPSSIGEVKGLLYMDLSNNNFSGMLPGSMLGNGTDLSCLYLSNNNFSGMTSVDSLNINVHLSVLDISNNILSGTIPIQLCNLSSLRFLDLSENRLFGSIPSCLNASSLSFLFLQKNSLSGSIPHVLSRSPNFVVLDLRDNKFTGNIPSWINQLSKLRVLSLGGNALRGHIPNQLCQLRIVSIMDLSHNLLFGSIPSCFNNFSILKNMSFGNMGAYNFGSESVGPPKFFNPDHPLYNATLEFEATDSLLHGSSSRTIQVEFEMKYRYDSYKGDIIKQVAGIDLSCNELTGSIPPEIGDLHEIRSLNLSHNHLSGFIPISFSNLKSLESLDLANNNLSGEIPSQLVELNFLEIFDVSNNNLSGKILDKGQFGTFDESSYRGNPGLCGPIINKSCNTDEVPPPPSNDKEEEKEDEGGVDMVWFYWSFSASYVTILLVLIAILNINKHWRMYWFYLVDVCIYSISIRLFGTNCLCM